MKVEMDTRASNIRRKQEAGLDEALEQTFPASDPFSVGQFTATEAPGRPADRKAPLVEPPDVRDRRKAAR